MVLDLLNTIRHEIDERLSELRPLLAEYERLVVAADALVVAGRDGAALSAETSAPAKRAQFEAAEVQPAVLQRSAAKPKPERAARGAAREAILAALDHGSHTVGELVVVTAMSGPNINDNLRRLVSERAVVKTEREGKAAWALADAAI
jgi:DNA-binding transcriptional ArsR family regulator